MILPASSSSKPGAPSPPPILVFTGPDRDNTIYIQHPDGSKTPIFTVTISKHSKPNVTISRVRQQQQQQQQQQQPPPPPPPPQPNDPGPQISNNTAFCTATFSSLSSSITLTLPNTQDLTLKDTTLDGSLTFPSPSGGDFKWKTSTGSTYELLDQAKTKIARYRVKSGEEPRLEVFVSCEESFVDLVVCSGVAVYSRKKKSLEEVGVAMEVVGQLLGAS